MLGYVARRFASLVAVLLAVTALAFSAMNVLGDPLFNVVGFISSVDCDAVEAGLVDDVSGQTAGGRGDCEVIAEARREHHLDRSLPVRYGYWLADSVRGEGLVDVRAAFALRPGEAWVRRAGAPRSLPLLLSALWRGGWCVFWRACVCFLVCVVPAFVLCLVLPFT